MALCYSTPTLIVMVSSILVVLLTTSWSSFSSATTTAKSFPSSSEFVGGHYSVAGDVFLTYEDWVNSEKNMKYEDYVRGDSSTRYERCVITRYAGLWPPPENQTTSVAYRKMICKDDSRWAYRSWKRSGLLWPPANFLTPLMKVPSFWTKHEAIYNDIVFPAQFNRPWERKRPMRLEDKICHICTYESWVGSEKKIKFDDGRNLSYEKCVVMEFAGAWDEKDHVQRESRIACESIIGSHGGSGASSTTWPPPDFLNALMKVPSFWTNHTLIYNHIIRPAALLHLL